MGRVPGEHRSYITFPTPFGYHFTLKCFLLSIFFLYCGFDDVFRGHQKFRLHEILALGLFWANLKYDEAGFSKFRFLRGVPKLALLLFIGCYP